MASQWAPGSSLYGAYWVDRPPLLIGIFEVAADLGGVRALRIIGMLAVALTVFLAAGIVRGAASRRNPSPAASALAAPVIVAGAFMSTPLFGTGQVDGELLSVPFVLAGVLALLRAFGSAEQRTMTLCAAAAGISASAAALVKQNVVDVFVFAAAVALTRLGSRDRRRALGILARFVLAAVGTGIVLVGLAALRGTEPLALWDAVTTFRFESMSVIQRNATAANSARLAGLLWAGSLSMAPVVIAGFAVQLRRGARDEPGGTTLVPDLRWPACALLAWEVVSIAGGGSYWLHYLLVLVPGLVVLGASAAQGPRPLGRFTAVALALAVGSSAAATILAASSPQSYSTDAEVISYLRVHGSPGDTVVVAFGHPNINWGVGMSSPYPQLWSLPVRVQDPGLVAFQEVLRSVAAPTWVVVSGDSLGTWGVDATQADRTLRSDYVLVTRVDRYGIWLRSSRSAG